MKIFFSLFFRPVEFFLFPFFLSQHLFIWCDVYSLFNIVFRLHVATQLLFDFSAILYLPNTDRLSSAKKKALNNFIWVNLTNSIQLNSIQFNILQQNMNTRELHIFYLESNIQITFSIQLIRFHCSLKSTGEYALHTHNTAIKTWANKCGMNTISKCTFCALRIPLFNFNNIMINGTFKDSKYTYEIIPIPRGKSLDSISLFSSNSL